MKNYVWLLECDMTDSSTKGWGFYPFGAIHLTRSDARILLNSIKIGNPDRKFRVRKYVSE